MADAIKKNLIIIELRLNKVEARYLRALTRNDLSSGESPEAHFCRESIWGALNKALSGE